MGLIKCIICKGNNFIIQRLGNLLPDTVGNTAGNSLLLITVDKDFPLRLNDLHFLLGNCTANIVRLPHGVTTQAAENLNDLLLVDNTAISNLQNWLQLRALIGDFLMIELILNKLWNRVHGAGTVESNNCGNIFNAICLHAHTNTGHTGGFQLEYTLGFAFRQHFKGLGVIVRDLIHGEFRIEFLDLQFRVTDNRQISQPQEVHLQKTQFFDGGHGILGDDGIVIPGKGYIRADRLRSNHNTGGVGGGVSGHTLQAHSRIDQLTDTLITVVHLLQLGRDIQRIL